MRVYVKLRRNKKGYTVLNKQGVKVATVDKLNLVDAYVTKLKGAKVLCGSYESYNEDVEAYHRLCDIDNLALDTVVMNGYDIYVQPLGTLLVKNNS
jgi:fructose-1-phosphate kinase PfkB-like protein